MPSGLTNEYRLLLLFARKVLTTQHLDEASAIVAAGLDWSLLDELAEEHGLSALLYWHLQRSFPLAISKKQERRSQLLQKNACKLFLSGTLLKLLEALHAAGIRVLAYKGPALAVILYGDPTLREMCDLDILIDPASFAAAREVLTSIGYQPSFQHSRKQEKNRLRSDCECGFSDSDGRVTVDLHWQITAHHLTPRFTFDELWNRRRLVSLGQKSVPTFSAEDTALVLAVHGGKHLWQRLGWLADFAESLRQDLDWQTLRLRARQARAERMLLLGLALAEDIMEVQLPTEFDMAINHDLMVQRIAAGIARTLFKDRDEVASTRVRWLAMLQLADSRWDGLRCAARFALESGPREWEAVRLPDSLFAFYHLLRIATLLRIAPSFFLPGRRISRG